jgi:hypothetical protein
VVKDNNLELATQRGIGNSAWNWQLIISALLEPNLLPERFSVGKRCGHVNSEAMSCLTQKQREHIGQCTGRLVSEHQFEDGTLGYK